MIYLHMDKNTYIHFLEDFPVLFPAIKIELLSCDDNLVALELCESAPCEIALHCEYDEYNRVLEFLTDLETDAFNTPDGNYPKSDSEEYKRYKKYCWLYGLMENEVYFEN